MVGEGINDGPALAAATVGFVLAQRASGTAIAVADVLLLRDNITGVPFCIAKSRQTTSLVLTKDLNNTETRCKLVRFIFHNIILQVKQNVAIALTSILLAALPSVLGYLPLWLTVMIMLLLLQSFFKTVSIDSYIVYSISQVLLHEGGTLLVCLNSIRSLNDPS